MIMSLIQLLTSRLNDLTQKLHFDSEIKKVDDKANKNSSEILAYEIRLKQKEDLINDFDTAGAQNYLVFKSISSSFSRNGANIPCWNQQGFIMIVTQF